MQDKPVFKVVVCLAALTVVAAVSLSVGCSPRHTQNTNASPPGQIGASGTDQPGSGSETQQEPDAYATAASSDEDRGEAMGSDRPDAGEATEATGKILEVSEGTFEQEVMQASKPMVVDFWATWCLPCHALRPILEELAQEYAGKLKFVGVEVGSHPGLAEEFGIRYIPTVVIIEDGKEAGRFGFMSEQQIREEIGKVAAAAK